MKTETEVRSAEILQFPARGRFARVARTDEARTDNPPLLKSANVAVGGAWYHDEAIQETERSRNS